MKYKYFNTASLSFLTIIILMSVALGLMFSMKVDIVFIIFTMILLMIFIINYIIFIRKSLKQIYQFFLAVKCNDSTIRFNKVKVTLLNDIFAEMNNKVNESNKKKLELETKKIYYVRI